MGCQSQCSITVSCYLMATKATLVLPCSAEKLATTAPAFDLYRGKGYMGVVRQWEYSAIKDAFNVLFLSAKHGLIWANECIEPYEQRLTPQRLKELSRSASHRRKAQRALRLVNATSPLYLMMPKAYQEAFYSLAGRTAQRFSQIEASSGGIGTQRGQLRRVITHEIASARQRASMDEVSIEYFDTTTPISWVELLVRVGDRFRPVVKGAGRSAQYGLPVTIAEIIASSNGDGVNFCDTQGRHWNRWSLTDGLTEEQLESLAPKLVRYKHAPLNSVRFSQLPSVCAS
ncbi:DUF6884 domain-containing protein [Aliagarivorans taiwanensis]|uniref:DUF6884 domain-containing protein n=1 Tax=Aliagarivorans taiwanensis TaxID=561966 RepID=UPI00041488BE|nr:DUF6884 domain-containing protein [Aliagarivorans taiwanensis]